MPREQRLIFGEDAELYDRARPSYPAKLIDDVIDLAGTPDRVLDIGCGTGKAAVLLAPRVRSGVGVEPDPDMARVAARNLEGFPAWTVTIGDFERFDAHTTFDLATAAQAWHWLNPEVRFERTHQLLRRGGRLALWWNRPDEDDSDLRQQIDAVYGKYFPTLSPHGILAGGRPPVGPVPAGLFGEPVERAYPWVQRYSSQEWIDVVQTHSNHRLLPADRLRPLLDAQIEVIDRQGGFYDHPYSTWLWTAERL